MANSNTESETEIFQIDISSEWRVIAALAFTTTVTVLAAVQMARFLKLLL